MAKGLKTFAPEILTRIFLHLPYKSLLSVMAVCGQWNAIVIEDPALSVQMFKRASKVYIEPACPEPRERGIHDIYGFIFGSYDKDPNYQRFKLAVPQHSESVVAAAWHKSRQNVDEAMALLSDSKWEPPERIRLHPAVPKVSYMMGNGLADACFFIAGNQVELSTLALANDFISIPAVTTVTLDVHSFTIIAKNSKGVTLLDLFSAMAKESTRKIKRGKNTIMKAELLGDHSFYEGFEQLRRTGKSLVAGLSLDS
ncbi:hypothetical protein B0H11DRAFT_2184279 [Mycena galericulata]|nr:hypothetical protein B0H11DRAFT_2184279 [Mycena galericulata]